MAIARTGVFVDDYLEYSSTLPAELQRLLNTIRELDERSQGIINQTRQQTNYCLGLASQSQGSRKYNYDDDEAFEKLRKEIEANQDNALSLCTEKVLLARQAHDIIDSHIKRLDEDLTNFAEDLKQGALNVSGLLACAPIFLGSNQWISSNCDVSPKLYFNKALFIEKTFALIMHSSIEQSFEDTSNFSLWVSSTFDASKLCCNKALFIRVKASWFMPQAAPWIYLPRS